MIIETSHSISMCLCSVGINVNMSSCTIYWTSGGQVSMSELDVRAIGCGPMRQAPTPQSGFVSFLQAIHFSSTSGHGLTQYVICRSAIQHDGHEQSWYAAWHDPHWQPDAHDSSYGHAKKHAPHEHVWYHVVSDPCISVQQGKVTPWQRLEGTSQQHLLADLDVEYC